MKRTAVILTIFLLTAGAVFAQQQELIPRRVYFELENSIAGGSELIPVLPELFYSSISAYQPIVRVESPDDADSVLRILVAADGDGLIITPELTTGGQIRAFIEYRADRNLSDYNAFMSYLNASAREIASDLPMVEPVVIETEQFQRNRALIEQVRYEDSLASTWELNLWVSGLLQQEGFVAGFNFPAPALTPVILEVSRFLGQNTALVAGLYFHQTKQWSFGRFQTSDTEAQIPASFLMPGVGVAFRTLDRFSAGASAMLFVGPGFIYNDSNEAVVWDKNKDGSYVHFMDPQSEKTVLYSMLRLSTSLAYSFTPKLAVKTRFGIGIHPVMLFGGGDTAITNYPTDGNGFNFFYLSMGVTYRID